MRATGLDEQAAAFDAQAGTFGMHLTLDGYQGDPALLADPVVIRQWLEEIPVLLGMDKLTEPCLVEVGARGAKDPGGVTGFVLIAQSHIGLHTFPRRGFVSADVFTCQDAFDHERVERSLAAAFGLREVESHVLRRGTRYPATNLFELPGVPAGPDPASDPASVSSPAPKARLLQRRVAHLDLAQHDTRALVEAFRGMSFSARDLGRAAEIYRAMLRDPDCVVILALAGSTSAGGCMQIYADLVEQGMIDVVVATGASVIDMDLFEALGFGHYQATPGIDTGGCASSRSIGSTTPTSTKRICRPATGPSRRSRGASRPGPIRRAVSSVRSAAGSPRSLSGSASPAR
jgi:S-adenosylmethionine/arginine decarboxylase-like enzyme